jgi:hypothetical protein
MSTIHRLTSGRSNVGQSDGYCHDIPRKLAERVMRSERSESTAAYRESASARCSSYRSTRPGSFRFATSNSARSPSARVVARPTPNNAMNPTHCLLGELPALTRLPYSVLKWAGLSSSLRLAKRGTARQGHRIGSLRRGYRSAPRGVSVGWFRLRWTAR